MPWRSVLLGDVVAVRSSLVDPTESSYQNFPHVAPDSIERDSGRMLPVRTVAEDGVTSGKYRFESGDLLYSKIRPNLNKVALASFDGLCSADMYALDVDRAKALPNYIAYVLRDSDFLSYATTLSNRANIPKLNRPQLMGYQFRLPPIEEQRRIADILDRADALRAKRREALRHLDDLTQSIFLDMFGGELATSSIGEICEVQSGLQVTARRASLSIERPYLRVANVHRGRLDLTEIKTIRLTESELARTQLGKGDVLVVEGHGNPSEIGRAAMWIGEIAECVHQNHLIRVRVDDRVMLPMFATSWLNSVRGRRHLLRAANTTSGLNTISTSDVKATPVPVPSIAAQRDFAHALEKRAAVANSMHLSSETTTGLFESLQQRAFAGLL